MRKSVGEILLERHRGAVPALDEVRAEVVQALATRPPQPEPEVCSRRQGWLTTVWQEWFVSCRRYWLGLGAAWCGMLVFALAQSGVGRTTPTAVGAVSPPMTQAMQEQLRLREELLGDVASHQAVADMEPPDHGPRSARRPEWVAV